LGVGVRGGKRDVLRVQLGPGSGVRGAERLPCESRVTGQIERSNKKQKDGVG
jgi:hypothetical protein